MEIGGPVKAAFTTGRCRLKGMAVCVIACTVTTLGIPEAVYPIDAIKRW